MGYNEVTGDKLINKELSAEGKNNWDLIFSNKEKTACVSEYSILNMKPCQSHGECEVDEHVCSCTNS